MFCHTKRTLDAAKQTSAIVDSYLVRYQRVNLMVFFFGVFVVEVVALSSLVALPRKTIFGT